MLVVEAQDASQLRERKLDRRRVPAGMVRLHHATQRVETHWLIWLHKVVMHPTSEQIGVRWMTYFWTKKKIIDTMLENVKEAGVVTVPKAAVHLEGEHHERIRQDFIVNQSHF